MLILLIHHDNYIGITFFCLLDKPFPAFNLCLIQVYKYLCVFVTSKTWPVPLCIVDKLNVAVYEIRKANKG